MPLFDRIDVASYALPTSLTRDLLSPALVVYLDRVRENVARVVDAVGGDPDRWRPHVKTSKIPEVWAELVRAGVRNFKCATTREAELLLQVLENEGERGDAILAYPLIGPSLRRLGDVAQRFGGQRVSVLCEDPDLVPEIPAWVDVFVDLNPGMNRTGVPLGETHRVREIARAAGERFRGLHYYDGHHHHDDPTARRDAVFAGYEELLELHTLLEREGHCVGEIVTAGTPAFLVALQYWPLRGLEETVHRVSPGTVVYHDARSEEQNPDFELSPAAVVFSRVISHPTAGRVTCDAGSKAVAAEAGDPIAHVLGRPELVAETPNEEHLPLLVTSGEPPPRGTELLLVPRHICPTINLADEAVLMDGGEVRAVVPVAARGHELLVSGELGVRARARP